MTTYCDWPNFSFRALTRATSSASKGLNLNPIILSVSLACKLTHLELLDVLAGAHCLLQQLGELRGVDELVEDGLIGREALQPIVAEIEQAGLGGFQESTPQVEEEVVEV